VVAVGEAKKPVELCKANQNDNWRNYEGQKSRETNNGICVVFAIWKIDPFMLHGIAGFCK